MPHFQANETTPEQASPRRTRLGLLLCLLYLVIYTGFVLLNAFAPAAMAWAPVWGINLAVLYGLGLIFVAFLLALLYEWLCREAQR